MSPVLTFVARADWIVVGSYVGDTLRSNYSLLKIAVDEKNMLGVLTNPYILAFTVVFLLLSILRRSYKPFLIPFSMWGYGLSWHFSLGSTKTDITDYLHTSAETMFPVVLFLAGFVIVTGLIIYFWIQDG